MNLILPLDRVTTVSYTHLVAEIERGLNNLMEKEVESTFIGELIMEQLKKVDQVAYVRSVAYTHLDVYKRQL